MALAQGDEELEELRAKRLAEMQSERQGQNEEKSRREEMQNMVLSQILSQDARARLNSIALVKPEKAKLIESNLLRMAQTGQVCPYHATRYIVLAYLICGMERNHSRKSEYVPNLRNLTEWLRFRNFKCLFYRIFHSGYLKCLIYGIISELGIYKIRNGIFCKIGI